MILRVDYFVEDGFLCAHAARAEELRDRVRSFGARHPEYREEYIAAAENALHGLHTLPGTGARLHFAGNPPRWHENPTADDEYLWVLNRHWHWERLLIAWAMTGHAPYAERVIEELKDWLDNCPCPSTERANFTGRGPWRILEAGIRMFESWPRLFDYLPGSEFLDDRLLARIVSAVKDHGRLLAELSPRLWPQADHNHYLMEMLGLLNLSCLFPGLDPEQHWRKMAMRELERCAANQITDDGGQLEGCPGYHNGVLDWFCYAVSLGDRYRLEFSPAFRERIHRMLTYSLHALRPCGGITPWGDSDSVMDVNLKSIVIGADTFRDREYLDQLSRLLGADLVRSYLVKCFPRISDPDRLGAALRPQQAPVPSLLNRQRELEQVMARTSWDRTAAGVFFACRSPVQNGHAHIDLLGFEFCALGRPMLVDPGRFCFRDDADRYRFKSAFSHNTVTVGGKEIFPYLDSWTFGPQREGHISEAVEHENGIEMAGWHDNYHPVRHYRRLYLDKQSRFLLIIDQLDNLLPGTELAIHFHLNFTAVQSVAGGISAIDGDIGLRLIPDRIRQIAVEESRISDRLDHAAAGSIIHFRDIAAGPRYRSAVLALPFRKDRCPSCLPPSWEGDICRCVVAGEELRIDVQPWSHL